MSRFITEKRHRFDDPKTAAPVHGHIIYRHIIVPAGETDGQPDCEDAQEFNDGLESDELNSSPFETKVNGYIMVDILAEKNFIAADEVVGLKYDISQSDLL